MFVWWWWWWWGGGSASSFSPALKYFLPTRIPGTSAWSSRHANVNERLGALPCISLSAIPPLPLLTYGGRRDAAILADGISRELWTVRLRAACVVRMRGCLHLAAIKYNEAEGEKKTQNVHYFPSSGERRVKSRGKGLLFSPVSFVKLL